MSAPNGADLIVLADRIRTLDPAHPYAQAVAMRDGVITAVGDRSDVRHWRSAGAEVIDLGAATVTPGLVDGHIHPMLGVGLANGADLSSVRSINSSTRCAPTVANTPTRNGCKAGAWIRMLLGGSRSHRSPS